ncbi:MAG: MFS transporter [Anaerolineae bacterium]
MGSVRWLAALATLGMVSHGLGQTILGPVLPRVMADLAIRETAVGILLAAGSLGFMSGCLLGGFVVDRIGLKPTLLAAWLGVVLSLGGCVASNGYPMLLVSYFLFGVGSGFIETGLNVLPTQIGGGAGLMNLVHMGYGVGALAAPLAAGLLLQAGQSWRVAFAAVAALAGVLLALAAISRMPEAPCRQAAASPTQPFSRLARSYLVVLSALALLFYVAGEHGMTSWSVLFMESRFGMDSLRAGAALSLFWGAVLVGRLLQGALLSRFSIPAAVVGSGVISGLAYFGFTAAPSAAVAYLAAAIAGLAAGGIYPNVIVYTNRRFPSQVGAVTGLLSMTAATGTFLFQPVVGRVAEVLSLSAGFLIISAAMTAVGACFLPVWLRQSRES